VFYMIKYISTHLINESYSPDWYSYAGIDQRSFITMLYTNYCTWVIVQYAHASIKYEVLPFV
jgi:hypothetical protein